MTVELILCGFQITRDGRIVDEPTFQRKAMHRDHYKRQKDTMASTTASRARETEVRKNHLP